MNKRKSVRPTIAELEAILNNEHAPDVEITSAGEVVVKGLRHEIESAINRVNAENGSNTPDFILADFLVSCLRAFDQATIERERWYGVQLHVGMPDTVIRHTDSAAEGRK